MRILVADDHRDSRVMLSRTLEHWSFDVVSASDGESAWTVLCDERPSMAILDWMMPPPDGPELCRRIRQDPAHSHLYVMLLTGRSSGKDLVAGLEAGADDYLVKPFLPDELKARVNVGVRVLSLQQTLTDRVTELQTALAKVRQLQGLLPICSYCKRIRSDNDYWEQIESYISQHSEAQFSHGICPGCMDRAISEFEKPQPVSRKAKADAGPQTRVSGAGDLLL